MRGPPPPDHRHAACLGEREGFVGGIDRQAGLVRSQTLPDPGLALEKADDMALPEAHLACEIVDDLVMDHLLSQAVGNGRGDVLAERTHFTSHCNKRHRMSPEVVLYICISE